MLKTVPFSKTPFAAIRKKDKKEPEKNSIKCSFLIDGSNTTREFSIDRSLNPEQVIQFLRCRWSIIPNGQLGLFVSGSASHNDRWLPNEPMEKCLDQCERVLMIRNKNKLMKIALPDGSLRTHLLDMTIPLGKVVETIAEKIQLPIQFWSEYSLCVEFDKESRQLELALKILQNAKSINGLKSLIKSAANDSHAKRVRPPLWLDTSRTLAELEPLINNRLIIFRRRFWFSQISDFVEEKRSLVFIQFQEVKEHLRIIGSLVRSSSIGLADAANLVAVLSKIEKTEKSEHSLQKVAHDLFPAHDTNAILQVIAAKQGAGEIRLPTDEFALQCTFIQQARELPGFGDTFFHARDIHGVDVMLAISKVSVTFYVDGKLDERYSIDRIRRWMALPEKGMFTMEIDHGLNEMVVRDWFTDDSAEVQQLLDGYVQLTLRHKRQLSLVNHVVSQAVDHALTVNERYI